MGRALFFRTNKQLQQDGGRVQRFPCIPFPSTCIALPVVNIIHQNSPFLTQDEPTLTRHNHPKSIVYLEFLLMTTYSMGLDKCIMTRIHHYSITQSIFAVLKFLCTLYSFPFYSPNPRQSLILLSP